MWAASMIFVGLLLICRRPGRLRPGLAHADQRAERIGADLVEQALDFFLDQLADAVFPAGDAGGQGQLFK
ncbi:MAG: hypothetical protein R3C45_21355 [Phycisphaerales bacterium]